MGTDTRIRALKNAQAVIKSKSDKLSADVQAFEERYKPLLAGHEEFLKEMKILSVQLSKVVALEPKHREWLHEAASCGTHYLSYVKAMRAFWALEKKILKLRKEALDAK